MIIFRVVKRHVLREVEPGLEPRATDLARVLRRICVLLHMNVASHFGGKDFVANMTLLQ